MQRLVLVVVLLFLAGCGSSQATSTSTPAEPTSTPRALPGETVTGGHPTPGPHPRPVAVERTYAAFVTDICLAFRSRHASAITAELPYFQYNSGLRYGQLGDGEGQTGDIGLMNTWLSHSAVRCVLYTPGEAGHGTLLTSGWSQPGGWALLDLDTYDGHWKINDFTFGKQADLTYAMHVMHPILPYRV